MQSTAGCWRAARPIQVGRIRAKIVSQSYLKAHGHYEPDDDPQATAHRSNWSLPSRALRDGWATGPAAAPLPRSIRPSTKQSGGPGRWHGSTRSLRQHPADDGWPCVSHVLRFLYSGWGTNKRETSRDHRAVSNGEEVSQFRRYLRLVSLGKHTKLSLYPFLNHGYSFVEHNNR
jgi:hypothetical protein